MHSKTDLQYFAPHVFLMILMRDGIDLHELHFLGVTPIGQVTPASWKEGEEEELSRVRSESKATIDVGCR